MSHLADIFFRRSFTWLLLIFVIMLPTSSGSAQTQVLPVDATAPDSTDATRKIDEQILKGLQQSQLEVAPKCSDEEFVRRIYLDLTGRIPTLEQLDEFLSESNSDKRERLIDELLASDTHFEYFAAIFDTMLMGRKDRKIAERRKHGWHDYLKRVFAENRPWDQVVREILLARGEGPQRGHLWFLYERENKHQEIAESVAKSFFGIDIACAQCHDHLVAQEIKQAHYWGLVGFFRRSTNVQTENGIGIAESAIGGFDDYANPLLGTTEKLSLSFLLREDVEEPRPVDPAQQEDNESLYVVVAGEPKVPLFSRREKFVEEIVKDHPLIARAMVNRVWGLLLGRGLVHPIERMDSTQPPSHPELLDWLAEDFRQHGYDIRRLVRAVVRSETYQRSVSTGQASSPDQSFANALAKPLTAEAYLRSLQVGLPFPPQIAESEKWGRLSSQWYKFFPEIIATNDQASMDQALGLTNGQEFHSLLQEAAEAWVSETATLSNEERIQHAYRRLFGRLPEAEEQEQIVAYLEARSNRTIAAWAQVFWTMATSAEFRFNH